MKRLFFRFVLFTILLIVLAGQGADAQRVLDDPDIQSLMGVEWYGIYIAGMKSGWAREELYEGDYNGRKMLTVKSESFMKVKMMGLAQEISTEELRHYNPETGEFAAVAGRLESPGSTVVAQARREGEQLVGTAEIGGMSREIRKSYGGETIFDALGEAYWSLQDPKVGEKKSYSTFDSTSLFDYIGSQAELKAISEERVQGENLRVFTYETHIPRLGLQVVAKYTEEGKMLENRMGNILFRLEEEETAKVITDVPDLISQNVVVPEKKIEDSFHLTRLVVEVSGLDDERLRINDNRQEYEEISDGKYRLTLSRIDPDPEKTPEIPVDLPHLRDHLAPEFLIQSDAAQIKALSKSIVGEDKDSLEAVRKIDDWIRENIKQKMTAAMSNALDTLHSREGDCTEHAAIFVALCRAAGIPARAVGGVVYSPDGEGFYFHQWADVFLGKWIAVDPIFHQIPADSTHIKLIEGNLSEHGILVNVFGNLKIEVLDYSHEEVNVPG